MDELSHFLPRQSSDIIKNTILSTISDVSGEEFKDPAPKAAIALTENLEGIEEKKGFLQNKEGKIDGAGDSGKRDDSSGGRLPIRPEGALGKGRRDIPAKRSIIFSCCLVGLFIIYLLYDQTINFFRDLMNDERIRNLITNLTQTIYREDSKCA